MRIFIGVILKMGDPCRLSDMSRGQSGTVVSLHAKGEIRRRLQDMGIVEGTCIECLQKSPLGDPVAFLVRGAVIALRVEDAECVCVDIIS